MNAERLLAYYDQVADAPDAVARVRRFILDLAVRGKLIFQDKKDEPALQLLEQMHQGRKYKKELSGIDEDDPEQSFPCLPLRWVWTTIDQIVADEENAITDGPFGSQLKTDHYIASPGFRVIRLQNIGNRTFKDAHRSYIDRSRYERLIKHHIKAGDLVVAGLVDPTVRCCEIPADIGPALVKADCYRFAVHPKLSSRYILYFLNSPLAQGFAAAHHHGMTLTRIGLGNFRCIPVPLPPAAEQHRIAAKVDELMSLCDRLESARMSREAARDRLAAASLARLNTPDPETFQADAHFALDALRELTARPEQIKALRQTILNLAVRGKLARQDPKDEAAPQLLKRIAVEKSQLVEKGAIPARKDPICDHSRTISGLPESWVLIALGQVCSLVTSGSRGWADFYAASGPGFIRAQNIRFGKIQLDDLAFVNPPIKSEGIRTKVAVGDLMIVITGAGVTNPALLDREIGEAYVSQHVGLVRPTNTQLSAWILLCLMADSGGRAELMDRAYGGGKPGLNLDNIRSLYSSPAPRRTTAHRRQGQ